MPTTPEQLFAYLHDLAIPVETVTHPPLFTVAQSQALRGQIPGGHSKNLFLRDKNGTLFLLSALEDARIDLKSLPGKLGCARLSFASADLLRETLGIEPGSVTPFALINDRAGHVTAVLDAALMRQAVLNFHPLTNTMTTSIAAADLLKFLRATGHEPQIVTAAGPALP